SPRKTAALAPHLGQALVRGCASADMGPKAIRAGRGTSMGRIEAQPGYRRPRGARAMAPAQPRLMEEIAPFQSAAILPWCPCVSEGHQFADFSRHEGHDGESVMGTAGHGSPQPALGA